MAGFTPINASASTASAASPTNPTSDGALPNPQINGRSSNSVVSDYLGRGETVPSAPVASQALRGQGAKKGRKRASTTTAASKPKRRKSGDVSETLTVSKPVARENSKPAAPPKKKPATAKQDAGTTPAKRKRGRAQDGDDDHDQAAQSAPELARPLPIYSQATTMNSLTLASQPTTVDALKASSKPGATIYSSNPTKPVERPGVTLTRPLLDSEVTAKAGHTGAAKAPAASDNDTDVVANVSRVSSVVRQPQLSPVPEEHDMDLMFDPASARVRPACCAEDRKGQRAEDSPAANASRFRRIDTGHDRAEAAKPKDEESTRASGADGRRLHLLGRL